MIGLKIKKILAEKAITTLKMKEILDPDLKVSSAGEYVIIPLIHEEIESALEGIEYEIIAYNFDLRQRRNKSLKEYLSHILPSDLEVPTSFDTIGKIAVIDIKDELLEYKKVIAEGLIKTSPKIRTVFRKKRAVSGKFRLRELEFLVGQNDSVALHREYGVSLLVDLQKVYFSPRLSSEHWRITQMIRDGETILDMFTATGIFALLICKYHLASVTALDHNPAGISALAQNITMNKLKGEIFPICSDAMVFESSDLFDRVIMNHPSGAEKFLMKADSLLKSGGFLHFYTFVSIENYEREASRILHQQLPQYKVVHVQRIRQFSPNEYHVAVDAIKLY